MRTIAIGLDTVSAVFDEGGLRFLRWLGQFLVPANFVQVILAVLVTAYVIQTVELREAADNQVQLLQQQSEILQRQLAAQHAPICDIIFETAERPSPSDVVPEGFVRRLIQANPKAVLWIPILRLHSDNPALDVTTVHFDKISKSYVWSGGQVPVVDGRQQMRFETVGKPITAQELQSTIAQSHPGNPACLLNLLNDTSESFVAVVYSSSLGTAFIQKQPYTFDKEQLQKLPTASCELSDTDPNTVMRLVTETE